ncbi:MAG: DUF4251 domain-containing protein [Pedobacter sp.]|nr:MAG: DUF4251 domain-containing protein [Pedobacter sp.]
MKSLKNIGLLALVLIVFTANAQTDKATTIKIVEEKSYVFVATTAVPLNSADITAVFSKMSGPPNSGAVNLTGSNYDLKITPDSIVAYLPYYGRAYVAPFGNDENGYKFTSKKFVYESKKGKKKGWDILIQSKDIRDNVRMNLSVSESGYATLNVISNNKQSISYNGYLSEIKKDNPAK